MTHQEGSVGAVPARSADTRSQSSLIARLSQEEEVRATTAEAENTWPWATLQQRRYHTARQNKRRRWVHSSAPASPPPGSHTVWSPASRTRTSSGGTLPATCSRAHTPRSHATAGRTTGQCTKRCDRDSTCAPTDASSPAQAVAEQHTAARSSCTVPTFHHSTAVALHRSAPCSSRHPKNLVTLSSLGSRKDA